MIDVLINNLGKTSVSQAANHANDAGFRCVAGLCHVIRLVLL